jgi:hypothetical protein
VTAWHPTRGQLSVLRIGPLLRFLEYREEKLGMRICPHDSYIVASNAVEALHLGPLVQYVTALSILDFIQFASVVQFAHIEELDQPLKRNQLRRSEA